MNNNGAYTGYDFYLSNNPCYAKAHAISVEFINYSKILMARNDYTILAPIINQCVRSSSSISANISEGICPVISPKDRINKFSIAYKETIETIHWISTLHDIGELPDEKYTHLLDECTQVAKMLNSSISTLRSKLNTKQKFKK